MRIGTTTLPLAGWVIDPRRPEKSRTQRLAAIRQIVERYRLSAVELTLDLGLVYPQVFDEGFYTTVADFQQELDFTCTVHLPFLWVDLCSLNEPIRLASVRCMHQAITLTQPIEVCTYALHLWGFTTTQIALQLQHPAQRQALLGVLMLQAQHSLAQVCQFLDPADLCVENLEDPLFNLALPLIEQQEVSICLDVGHLFRRGGGELGLVARHSDRIREVHLHDAVRASPGEQTQSQDHLALGEGQVDYLALLNRLEEMDYSGPVILELNNQTDLEKSLEQIEVFLR